MNDALKALLALDRPGLAQFLDHRKLISSPVFEEICRDAVQDYKENGDTTILLRLIKMFEHTPLKPILVMSLSKAAGLRSYLKNGEIQLSKTDAPDTRADFDLKTSLAERAPRPGHGGSGAGKPKKYKKSPQRAKGPKHPKVAGERRDPYAPRGKNAPRFDTGGNEGNNEGGRYAKPSPKGYYQTAVPRKGGKFDKPKHEGSSVAARDEPRSFAKPSARPAGKPVGRPNGKPAGKPFGKPKFAGRKKR